MDDAVADEVAAILAGWAGPGRRLEASVVDAANAARPARPWPFLLHVTTGEARKVVLGRTHGGDPDLVMHYAVVGETGIVVRQPAATDVDGPVARHDVLRYLVDELGWAVRYGGEAYAGSTHLRFRPQVGRVRLA